MEKYDLHCFIDTNSFLHYRLFTEIDWNKVSNSKSVKLVLCSTVIKELDEKKFSEYNLNLRHRAQKVVTKISEILTSGLVSIKKNVDIKFIPNEPSIDWTKEKLDPQIPDDRIIATILEQQNNFENIVLVTSDAGLKLKASLRGIDIISLPLEYKLSEKKDKKEKENEELKNRIALLENRLPVLSLKILNDDEPSDFIEVKLTQYATPSDQELTERLDVLKKELEYKPQSKPMGGILGVFQDISEDELKRYKNDLDKYIEKMPDYFKKEIAFKEYQSRLIELRFAILNSGNQPGEDIEIFIHFPNGFEVLSEEEVLEKPDEPERPTSPRSLHDTMYGLRNFSFPTNLSDIITPRINPNLNVNLPSGPRIKKTNSYAVSYDAQKLKHGLMRRLDPIYILFKSTTKAKSFKISYSILADNLPEPSKGTLNVVIYK